MIVGESLGIQELKEKIKVVAPSSTSVLVIGETGTGKELVANELHNQNARVRNKIVKVNCAAVQDTLMESELFGHMKGAFTGAHIKKVGKLQIADGGTLVLDELSNMSMAIQAKILRAVEEQEFEMVGGTETFHIDTRIISLSNKDMIEMVKQDKFRNDLFYRLGTIILTVPPLRERAGDIPILARHYVTIFKQKYNKQEAITSISEKALDKLQKYYWPGNVRELKNVLEQAVLFCSGHQITEDIIVFNSTNRNNLITTPSEELIEYTVRHLSRNGYRKKMQAAIDDIELAWITTSLKETNYVQKDAAKLLGISPRVFCYKLDRQRQRTGKEIPGGLQTVSKRGT